MNKIRNGGTDWGGVSVFGEAGQSNRLQIGKTERAETRLNRCK